MEDNLYRTAERPAPGKTSLSAFQKDIVRYHFAAKFIAQRRVLDVGCGVGMGTKAMFEQDAPREVLA